ncbi:hypothetical protein Y032_0009g604 [Ancylostoma ceylanicum]|uniref:Uncharacterized protein n=1 Tax=Ancylostoma ceylanicum TaxID=53326 RepID=A0A016VII4_9BILA|nr:hypothetical protein Y032_0009g604 [Ancylostoma ceylanicum]
MTITSGEQITRKMSENYAKSARIYPKCKFEQISLILCVNSSGIYWNREKTANCHPADFAYSTCIFFRK